MLRPRRPAALVLLDCRSPAATCSASTRPRRSRRRKEAEGKAIGGACRHAGRAIEDCYALNKKADKAAVFAGWREMNDYMRENKIEAVAPQVNAGEPRSAAKSRSPRRSGRSRTTRPRAKKHDS